ncbi:hypothetical protein BJ546DRAFT_1057918 [Cryomyces antarcticus]|uniref:Ubiquinol-cytochrome-c reductase cytochrome c1 n=1 Tax=Cryomyces antarcticus TaxID=329879 RepID=A0ABR0MB39_9PEZI|nr:hypothetical protein LTR39_000180 [Cryomyces antarcticus]KAK5020509.1 hypothetical protein LTR60_000450 [Cryomyces antarcticus]KAK5295685.1 hypothetical protein LTR16_000909 [Cryomyces antarcticus]
MAKNPPDERLVYLALKNIFKGIDAQMRKPKKTRELVQRHQHCTDLRDLIHEHNIDNVCNMAKALLEQQVFESTLKAKIRFPEVFEVSPAQSAEREASEAEAAKTEADAIRGAAEGRQGASTLVEGEGKGILQKGNERQTSFHSSASQSRKRSFPHTTISVPSLYPVYLPLKTQHQVLVKVQGVLERACYSFGQKTMRDILEKEGWDCPEAVELNRWPRLFLLHQDQFAADEIDELGNAFPQLLDSIAQLRHTAVHRVRVTVHRIEQFMIDSESLAKLLQEDTCAKTLSRLRRETQLSVDELKRNKDLLESRLAETVKKIAAQRAQLEQLERTAMEDMLREDKEYQTFAGANLEQTIISPETVVQSVATTENETFSEADVDADSFGDHGIGQIG